jgi:signal transduction histidine kinase
VIEAIKKLLRNTLFRLSLLGAMLTMVSVAAALGLVYYSMIETELGRVEQANIDEIAELQKLYDDAGLARVTAAKEAGIVPPDLPTEAAQYKQLYDAGGITAVERAVTVRGASYEALYFLQTRRVVRGNILGQGDLLNSENIVGDDGPKGFSKIRFLYSDPNSDSEDFIDRRARGIVGNLKLGEDRVAAIIVGRDVEAISRTGDRIRATLPPALALAAFLGLLSSWFVSRSFAARVEAFNRLATDVRAGNLDRRAPRNYSEDEMDLLAEHLNSMLDHIDRLMQAMRYAGDSIAHDLRSPLTRLRTRLESAAVELGDTKEADVLFSAAEDASELLTTFDGVLRIARLEAGERRELLQPTDPKPLLDDLAELYEPACEDAGLAFSADIAKGTDILADRGLLSQAVSNLVENAIKYTPKGGRIHLELRKTRNGRVVISVTDDGPGIPPEDRDRVKERFVRLDKSRTLPGSGLGLALVDAVADLHRAEFVMEDGFKERETRGLKANLIFARRRPGVKTDEKPKDKSK